MPALRILQEGAGSARFVSVPDFFNNSSVRFGSVRTIIFPGSTRFGLRLSDASWLGPVRFGSAASWKSNDLALQELGAATLLPRVLLSRSRNPCFEILNFNLGAATFLITARSPIAKSEPAKLSAPGGRRAAPAFRGTARSAARDGRLLTILSRPVSTVP